MPRRLTYLTLGLILLLTGVVYAQAIDHPFIALDDALLITHNPIVRTLSLKNIAAAFTTFDPELYVPLTMLSYQIEYLFFGADPMIYHINNLLLHLLCIVLVFFLILKLCKKQAVALLVAALFALHPINVEAVAWAAARKDLLSATFFLSTCLTYLQFRESKKRKYFALSLFLFLCGLLSKVTIVGLPIVLLACDWMRGEHVWKKSAWRRLAPFFLLSLLFALIAIFGKSDAWGIEQVSSVERLRLLLIGSVFPLAKLFFWPPAFSVMYPLQDVSFFPLLFVACGGLTMMLWTLIVRPLKISVAEVLLFCALFYLAMLLPSLTNLVKAGEAYVGSDRYAYLASIGVFLLFALMLEYILRKEQILGILTLVIGLALAPVTYAQVHLWSDTRLLFEHSLRSYPHSAAAHLVLGNLCYDAKQADCARLEYEQALEILPSMRTYSALGSAYAEMREDTLAERAYQKALEFDPTYGSAYMGLGLIAERRGDTDAQIEYFEKALQWTSDRVSFRNRIFLHTNLAAAYGNKGDLKKEILHEKEAIRLDPGFAPAYYNMSKAFQELGRMEEAEVLLEKAFELDPGLRSLQ